MTKRLKREGQPLAAPFRELATWIAATYGVPVLNFYYDTVAPHDRPRLNVIFEFQQDARKFRAGDWGGFDAIKQAQVREQFVSILAHHPEHRFKPEELFVIFTAFEPVARIEANERVTEREVERLKQALANPDLWEISRCFDGVTFFFYTDAQVKAADARGLRDTYTEAYARLVEAHDEFGYFKRRGIHAHFDSKENFDTNFQSNWYYYYK